MPEEMNHIERFIQNKLDSYIEPVRKGIPKGQVIGLTKKYYHASLLCALSCERQKDIAEKVGITQNRLSVSRCRDSFKREIVSHKVEFLNIFLRHPSTMSLWKILRQYVFDNSSKDDLIKLLYNKTR